MATSAPKTAPKLVTKGPGDEGAPVAAKKSSKAIVISIIAVTVLAGASGSAYFFMSKGEKPPVEATDPDAPPAEVVKPKVDPGKPPRFFMVEPFTVNLQHEGTGDQFLQIAFTAQLADEKQENFLKLYMPQARSRMLLLLSGKKASEISTVKGKEKLAEELVTLLKQPFTPGGESLEISNIFFTAFVIQ